MTPTAELSVKVSRLWAPPPDLTVSQWTDRYRRLSSESSSEHGRTTCYSFQREPLDSVSDPRVRRTVIKSATQLLKTFTIENSIGYFATQDPGPILVLQPGDEDAKDFSKERIAPMIRDTPVLKAIFSESKTRVSDNTLKEKMFPGGMLAIAGAGSVRNVARRAIRFLFADEIDKYPPSKEGDILALARKRLATFRHRAKEVDTCSPTFEDSGIDQAYKQSDQREYYVPCPKCGEFQSMMLRWSQVRWSQAPTLSRKERIETALYHCIVCDSGWGDAERWEAVNRGQWRAHAPFSGVAGFWISELYSPWKQLSQIVDDFLQAGKDPERLQTFTNTSLAENWQEPGEAPDWEKLMSRREASYRLGQVPSEVLFLTAGVDVQQRWIEGYVFGWGRGKQRWLIDRFRIEASPFEQIAWDELSDHLNATYRSESGLDLSIVRMGVDSGFATQEVYAWARAHGSSRVLALDPRPSGVALIGSPTIVDVSVAGRKVKRGGKIWPVNVSMAKSELYGLLGKERPEEGAPYPAGWVHFPADIDDEFFKQLTAEQLVARMVKGYRKTEWNKIRERNEALDCCNYARAAASQFGIDRFAEQRWAELEQQMGTAAPVVAISPVVQPTPAAPKPEPPQTATLRSPTESFYHPERAERERGRFDRGARWFR